MSHQLSRAVRLSQTLAPFGVGAIYDLRGESLIACDISHWKNQGQPIHSRRLAEALGVEGFQSAPVSASLYGQGHARVPYYRFPQWLFCPACRGLTRWSIKKEVKDEPARCASCARRPQLVPMRFVMACEQGHLGDVPWERWAHFGAKEPKQKGCKDRENLRFIARAGSGAGLQSLLIACKTCGVRRPLSGITSQDTIKAMALRCPGKQPWEYLEGQSECTEPPVVLQRGASNVYFSSIRSALDIPPESTYQEFGELTLKVSNSPYWTAIRTAPTSPIADLAIPAIAQEVGCSEEQVRLIMRQELGDKKPPRQSAAGAADLETDEWLAFITPQGEQSERSTFLTRHVQLFPTAEPPVPGSALELLGQLIDKVVLATKLREVRALVGFSRYNAAGPLVKPDLGRGLKWLPAVEVFGEGIFFSLNERLLGKWETENAQVEKIGQKLEKRRQQHFIGSRLKQATPRFVLLHTLAHALIRQLSFQCGYSSASLRERIYAGKGADGEPQAGILIYTAAGDVEGTLGGLVRQGTPPLLAHTLLSALERASWCSSDPICRESPGQGFGALNLGACHACALVSETSCENANVLLDRGLLVGTPGGVPGFFEEVLAAAQRDSARANSLETDD